MKKLILTIAVVATAVHSQATSVKWGIDGTLDTTKFASATAYLFCESGNSALARQTFADDAAAKTWYSANGSSLESTAFRKKSVTAGTTANTAETITTPTGSANYWLLIVNEDASALAVSTLSKTINITSSSMTKNAIWDASSQMSTYSLTNVPEPTSAMLLLLGFAGLALKRKRA